MLSLVQSLGEFRSMFDSDFELGILQTLETGINTDENEAAYVRAQLLILDALAEKFGEAAAFSPEGVSMATSNLSTLHQVFGYKGCKHVYRFASDIAEVLVHTDLSTIPASIVEHVPYSTVVLQSKNMDSLIRSGSAASSLVVTLCPGSGAREDWVAIISVVYDKKSMLSSQSFRYTIPSSAKTIQDVFDETLNIMFESQSEDVIKDLVDSDFEFHSNLLRVVFSLLAYVSYALDDMKEIRLSKAQRKRERSLPSGFEPTIINVGENVIRKLMDRYSEAVLSGKYCCRYVCDFDGFVREFVWNKVDATVS